MLIDQVYIQCDGEYKFRVDWDPKLLLIYNRSSDAVPVVSVKPSDGYCFTPPSSPVASVERREHIGETLYRIGLCSDIPIGGLIFKSAP